jgi:hypothetical protein
MRPSSRPSVGSCVATAGVAVALLLTGLLLPVGASSSAAGATDPAPLLFAAGSACTGKEATSPATGTLALVGNSTPLPSVSGVSVTVGYFYTEIEKVENTTTESCIATSASTTTQTDGAYSVGLPIPSDRCEPTVCVEYAGPYGPLSAKTSGAPEGFYEEDLPTGTAPGTIDWDADLYGATLNQTGTQVVSANAPVEISASAWDATGAAAPGAPSFVWTLAGLGWSPAAQGANITVEGSDGGWTGSLFVTVSATYGSTSETAQSPVLSLLPVATKVSSATTSVNPVDPGVPVTFEVTGSGAGGYPYTVTVDPGLGAGTVSAACASLPLPDGSANLSCEVQAAYPTSGTALPTALISNGYSSGIFDLAPLPVHPVEEVTLSAPSLFTYPERPIDLSVNVTNGTGSAPYGPACLSANGSPDLSCQTENATSWTFEVAFPSPGLYQLRASVTDRFGENVTGSIGVVVFPFLAARANGSSSVHLFANQTAALTVIVTGGALPIAVWWNVSGSRTFLCPGTLDFDGTIACPYEPLTVGATQLTATVRDALGTETSVVFRLNVTAAPVHDGNLGSPGDSLFAGTPGEILLGALVAIALALVLVAWQVHRRRAATTGGRQEGVEENELERMARGREHLLAQADPVLPRRPDELVEGWTGPPVAPEEWAEWIAALVADGSLVPSRADDHRLVYRRAVHRPTTPTIEFDPTALPTRPGPTEDDEDPTARRGAD